MKIEDTGFEGLKIVIPRIFKDTRGYFYESYNKTKFFENNLIFDFIQDNQSESQYGTVRGLHFQSNPFAQAKLVRVLSGKIIDVALDLRSRSHSYGQFFSIELTDKNHKQLLIPKGFAHGFSVLSKTAVVSYKIDNLYNPDYEMGIAYNDPELNIDWKLNDKDMIISEKDKQNEIFNKSNIYFE